MAEIGKITPGSPTWPAGRRPIPPEQEGESPEDKDKENPETDEQETPTRDDNDKKDDGHIDVYV